MGSRGLLGIGGCWLFLAILFIIADDGDILMYGQMRYARLQLWSLIRVDRDLAAPCALKCALLRKWLVAWEEAGVVRVVRVTSCDLTPTSG